MSLNKADIKRVMIVDDSVNSAQAMAWMFELVSEHDVKFVNDGASAVALAATFLPDLVMLDIGMPGMNGYEVCKLMRQNPSHKNMMIVAQTGWSQKEHYQRTKEAGFDNHLVKPVTLETIKNVLVTMEAKAA